MLMRAGRRLLGYLIDLAAFSLSAFVAFGLRFDGKPPSQFIHPWVTGTCIWAVAKSIAFLIARVSWGHWRFTSTHEVVRIVLANLLGSLLGGLWILLVLGFGTVPRSIFLIDCLLCCALTLTARLVVRLA